MTQIFPLQTILDTFSNQKGNKLTIFNAAPVGGFHSTIIKLFIVLLPFIEFALIFNPYIFNIFGIATAIVVYIVFLSIVMVLIFLIIQKVKKRVIKKITPSWKHYFPDIGLTMVLSSGITPYSDFFKHYSLMKIKNLDESALYLELQKAFAQMQEENKELLIAIKKDNKNI